MRSSPSWTNLRNSSSSSSGKPSICRITLTGMCCAYCTAASTTVSPGVMSPMSSSNLWHRVRTSGSHGSIFFGANGGRSRRRAMPWNGGSLVIGGTTPIGAGSARSPGRPTRDDHRPAGEVLGVVGDLVDRVVRERHPHAAVAIGVRNRTAGLADFLPHLGCVRVVGRVGVVEVGGEVLDRAVVGLVVGHALPDVGSLGAWSR